ncbi:hypothetical protein DFH28DRAFT_924675 [Melampsora americana]|nr:hypothetical protein DFH28DRAFT_924675 [Melampsora americana]
MFTKFIKAHPSIRANNLRFCNYQHRTYWINQTFTSHSPKDLLENVQKALFLSNSTSTSRRSPLLFTISKHLPSTDLSELVKIFQNVQTSYEPIGCLSDTLSLEQKVSEPLQRLHSVAFAKWYDEEGFEGLDPISFKSTGFSRPPISVGREILPNLKDLKEDERLELALDLDHQHSFSFKDHHHHSKWDELWSRSDLKGEIPVELNSIPPDNVKSIIFFTSRAPEALLEGLKMRFASASLLGLIAASTPFETGRACTLFRDGWIGDDGAVGVALVDSSNKLSRRLPKVQYHGLRAIGKPMKITSARGNIILMLDKENAAQALMTAIKEDSQYIANGSLPIGKEDDIFVAFFSADPSKDSDSMISQSEHLLEISRIVGGAPSRGALGIDRTDHIPNDSWVQFVVLSKQLQQKTKPLDGQFQFGCATESGLNHSPHQLESTFIAASEHGFIANPTGKGKAFVINVQGTRAAL